MPTVSTWNCPVIFLFLFYLVNFSLGFRAKEKANSETHFVQGGNPGTCAQRPGCEEWVSIGAVPGYLQSSFVVDAVKTWQHVFFCVLRGWPRKSHCVVSAQNLPNAVTWWPNNFWQEAVWTELQHHAEARAVPLGFRRENQFCLSCLLSCWETKYTYAVCGNDMLIYCIDSYASLRLIRLIQLCHTPVIFCWGVNLFGKNDMNYEKHCKSPVNHDQIAFCLWWIDRCAVAEVLCDCGPRQQRLAQIAWSKALPNAWFTWQSPQL